MRLLLLAPLLAALVAVAGADSAPAAAAKPDGRTRVAFQGSASLFTYYSGASWALQRAGVINSQTKLSGLSGGAHTSLFTALGQDGPTQREFWIQTLSLTIARFGNITGVFNNVYDQRLREPSFQGAARKADGRVTIAISQLQSSKTDFLNSAVWLVDRYANDRELASALTASSHIPCFSGRDTYAVFKGQPVIDGGFANGFEELCREGPNKCIKIGSWFVGSNTPGDTKDCEVSKRTGRVPMRRGKPAYWDSNLAHSRYLDIASIDAVKDRCPMEVYRTGAPFLPEAPFVPQNSVTPDVYPGKYNSLPFWSDDPNGTPKQVTPCEWQRWAMKPAIVVFDGDKPVKDADGKYLITEESIRRFLTMIYEQGYKDARSWLKEKYPTVEIPEDSGPNA